MCDTRGLCRIRPILFIHPRKVVGATMAAHYTCETQQMRASPSILRTSRGMNEGRKGVLYVSFVVTLSFNFINPIVPSARGGCIKSPLRWEHTLVVGDGIPCLFSTSLRQTAALLRSLNVP